MSHQARTVPSLCFCAEPVIHLPSNVAIPSQFSEWSTGPSLSPYSRRTGFYLEKSTRAHSKLIISVAQWSCYNLLYQVIKKPEINHFKPLFQRKLCSPYPFKIFMIDAVTMFIKY